ncbi:hypothetical protein QOT38_30550, partial [Pseudomonas aeruginosa]
MSSATVRLDHAALRETLRQLFGLPAGSVVDADQLLAPPAIPFMTLRLESSSLLGKVRREFSASGEQESLLASCESIFRLTWHGPEVRIPRSSGHPFHEHLTTDSTVIRPPI